MQSVAIIRFGPVGFNRNRFGQSACRMQKKRLGGVPSNTIDLNGFLSLDNLTTVTKRKDDPGRTARLPAAAYVTATDSIRECCQL